MFVLNQLLIISLRESIWLSFVLFFSASSGQFAFETKFDDTQKTYGVFTYTLVQELKQSREDIFRNELFKKVHEAVKLKYPKQTPFFLGDLEKPYFFADFDQCPENFTFSQRRCYMAFDNRSLQNLHQKINRQFTTVFPDFNYSLGLAYLEKENNSQSLVSLETAVKQAKQKREEQLFYLGISQFKNQLYSDSCQTFQQCLDKTNSDICKRLYGNVISSLDALNKSKRCALLIGIDTSYTSYYNGDAVTVIKDSVGDTLALKNILVSKYGFQLEDIRVLNNQDATYQNILEAFNELVDVSRVNSTLFYFAGIGSVDASDNPTILAFDSRTKDIPDILLSDLAQLANPNEVNLVSVIDSCWTIGGEPFVECIESVFLSSNRKLTALFDDNAIERDDSRIPKIGNLSIYAPSIKYRKCETLLKNLTPLLIQFLNAESLETNTYQTFYQFYKKENRSCSDGRFYDGLYFPENTGISDVPFFDSIRLYSKIQDSLIKILEEPTQQTVMILKRLIEKRNGAAPEERFNLGIAYYRLNKYDESISNLERAIDQVSGQNSTITDGQSTSLKFYPEAHYWLGRVLYESKRDPARAVSELRLATQQSPDNIAAHYYLGKALRALVEQEILIEAEQAFQTYLNEGAPLGQQEEVQEFIKSRSASRKFGMVQK